MEKLSYNRNNLQSNIPYKYIRSVEILVLTTIYILVLSASLIAFKLFFLANTLIIALAGVLIIAAIVLEIFLIKKNVALNKKYEALIISMHREYDKKIKIITMFSHKIREPLNNLTVTEDMLKGDDLTPKQKEFAETVNASYRSMVSVVNELTMTVAEDASLESERQIQFNIGSTIEHVIELYCIRNPKNLDIEFVKTEAVNFECIGDPVIIKQIFIDIFGRIEKQNHDRQITVKISLNLVEESPSENTIAIMIEANLEMLLIDETDFEGYRPANLISLMKGKYVQDVSNNLVMVNMLLKIQKDVETSKEKISSSKIQESMNKNKEQKNLNELRVLLVDDNTINSRIVQLALKPLVQSVDLAYDGKEALDKFTTNTYDIILMDIEMPVVDGLTAIEKIRALESTANRYIPIIALTANAMISDKEKCLSAGANDYISKPFQPAQLVEKIKQFI